MFLRILEYMNKRIVRLYIYVYHAHNLRIYLNIKMAYWIRKTHSTIGCYFNVNATTLAIYSAYKYQSIALNECFLESISTKFYSMLSVGKSLDLGGTSI